jgi:hypothetical protein
VLKHSNSWTQITCRSPFFMAVMVLAGLARWRTPGRAAFHAGKLGWLGLASRGHCCHRASPRDGHTP